MRLLLIRHGPTVWNETGRLQGRADVPLSGAGRALVASWRLPLEWRGSEIVASPLVRARETAEILASRPVAVEPALIEMNWGGFEGRRLADLRQEDPEGMAANEGAGLDFRPPGGESPREVRDRLARALPILAESHERLIAVTHKGVMRAALSLATGWDMTTKPPLRMGRATGLGLWVEGRGRVQVDGSVVALGRGA
jgi:broad specificity phosphatase PhoE